MKPFIPLLISAILFGGSPIKDASEVFITSQFGDSVSIKMNTLHLNAELKSQLQNTIRQTFYRDELYYWTISQNDSTLAHAFLDNVLGKSMPITFLVLFNTEGEIISSEVIKYREAYGGEVGNKNWLSQFIHFSDTSDYSVGKNIDGISGATISVNSLSRGIRKIALLYPLVKDELK